MTTPTIQQVTEAELRWIDSQLEAGRSFVARYSPSHVGSDMNLVSLDAAWSAWMDTTPSDTDDINHAINCIGISFGSLLVRSGDFEWCIASDDWGTDLAVLALPDRGDVLVYPADFVSKRWESGTTDFLTDAFPEILAHVEKIRLDWEAAGPTA